MEPSSQSLKVKLRVFFSRQESLGAKLTVRLEEKLWRDEILFSEPIWN